jgi:hypothetical protein
MRKYIFLLACLLISPLFGAELEIPKQGAYTGAYIDAGATEDEVDIAKLVAFEKLVGKPQAIIGFSNFWGKKEFPAKQVSEIQKYGAIPLIYWAPWDEPYEVHQSQPKISLSKISSGEFDDYLRKWFRKSKEFDTPILVAWGLEMNGDWFPWSGVNYGKSKGPTQFIEAYRHIVDLAREEKATHLQWVFHANHFSSPEKDWNRIAAYYPGDSYADWLGISAYGMQLSKDNWEEFRNMTEDPIQELSKLHPTKPIMLAEWGVGEFPKKGSKADFIRDGFIQMEKEYPRIKAAIYWHELWKNSDKTESNLKIDSSPEALAAYRRGLSSSHWLGRPILRRN